MENVIVHSMTRAGRDCLLVELRAHAKPLPGYEAGAHIDVTLGSGQGMKVVRQYSLVGPPEEKSSTYLIAVGLAEASRGGSRYIHHSLRVGDTLEISAPRNHFGLVEARRYLLVGGGIGVTPLVAMAQQLHAAGQMFELHLYARSYEDAPLLEYLQQSPIRDRVVVHLSATGHSLRQAQRLDWDYQPGDALYLCGPQGFMQQASMLAQAQSWPQADIYRENFSPTVEVHRSGEEFSVIAQSTGEVMAVPGSSTIAEVLREHGYHVELSCEQGICGSCILGVVSGIPDHRDEVQTAQEHALNNQINVCCSRAHSSAITLAI